MKSKIFYGWWIILSMFMVMLVHAGAVFYVFGIFYNPLIDEFGWNRAAISAAISIYMLTLGFSAPLVGKLTDKLGPKKVILAGVFVGGIALFLLGRIDYLWQLYLLYFIVGLGFSACGIIPASSAIANWFVAKRGIAIGITMAGVALGAFVITSVSGYVMANSDWRTTYSFLGFISWLLVIPIVLFAMKNTPQEIELLPDGVETADKSEDAVIANKKNDPVEEVEWTFSSAIRSMTFWPLAISFFLIFFCIGAVLQHEVNYLLDLGIDKVVAASALGLTGAIGGFGKIFFGYIADKMSPKRVATITFVLQGIGIMILLLTKSMTHVWIFVFIFGFSMGGQLALQPLIIGEIFGLSSFGIIYGTIMMAGAIGGACGPVIAGLVYDLAGSYFWVFSGCVIAALAAAVFISFVKPKQSQVSQELSPSSVT